MRGCRCAGLRPHKPFIIAARALKEEARRHLGSCAFRDLKNAAPCGHGSFLFAIVVKRFPMIQGDNGLMGLFNRPFMAFH